MNRTLITLLLLAPAALAEVKPRLAGEYRLRGSAGNGIELQGGACDAGEPDRSRCVGGAWMEHRLRLSPSLELWEGLTIAAEADFLDGPWLGRRTAGFDGIVEQTWGRLDGIDVTRWTPRRLSVNWLSPIGRLVVGMMPANWGAGIVANNGAETPEWGENRFGDTALRALFATQPLAGSMPQGRRDAWTLVLAADLTYKDESASLVDGDRSWQLIFANQIKPIQEWTVGNYLVGRMQTSADGAKIQALVVDLMTSYARKLEGGVEVRLDGEIAWIRGRTNTVRNLAAPGLDPDGEDWLQVDQLGWMLRGRATRGPLALEMEVGYASGDENPFDAAATNFSFDRDYNLSLLMFEEVLAWQSAAAVRRVANPDLVGEPPAGYKRLATGGAVTNAIYAKPTVRYRPLDKLTLAFAALWARAPHPVIDAYATNAHGGDPRNFFDAPAGRSYGMELDAGASYTVIPPPEDPLAYPGLFAPQLVVGAQAGVFFPGDVFALPTRDGSTTPGPQLGGAVRAAVRF